jgi:phage terminase large subunit-like protein
MAAMSAAQKAEFKARMDAGKAKAKERAANHKAIISVPANATKEQKERELLKQCFRSVKDFVRVFMKDHITSEIPEFHDEIYQYLHDEKRLLLTAPRGFAKSYLCSVFYPLWSLLYQEKKKILIISASEDKAIEFLRMIKTELESNKLIKAFFGTLISKKKWTESNIITNTGIEIKAKGAEGQIRGYRPDLIILDDIETEDSVATPERRRKLETWIFKAAFNSLTPNGQFVWVGTILTHLALINEYLEKDNGWVKKRYQAYREGIQEESYELWPELWPHDRLQQQKREIGSMFFSTEFMNDPLADETAPIKQHMIREWTEQNELPPTMNSVIILDPAYADHQGADEKVAVRIGFDSRNRRYLLDLIHTRESQNSYIHQIINLWQQNKSNVTAVGIPKGAEGAFWNSFKNECDLLGASAIPIAELKNSFTNSAGVSRRNKTARVIMALQPIFEQGRYLIGRHHGAAKDQLLSIGSSKHDDIVDAMASAEQLIDPSIEELDVRETDRYGIPIDKDYDDDDNDFDTGYGY